MEIKEQAKERIKELVNDFKEGERVWNNKPEEDIKFQFIEPLFEALGWDRKDISKEQRVLKGRADYILKNGNQEVLVIEAKKTDVVLAEDEGRQAVSYAYHRKIKFAVLTNFKDIRVYHALSNIKDIDKNLLKKDGAYFRLNYSEFLDKFDLLWLLSKESFEKGEINKLLSTKDEKINKPIDANILEDLLYIRELLSKELKSKKNYLEKETIDEVTQILIDRLIFIRSVEDRGLEPINYLKSLESDVRQQRTKLQLFPYLLEKFDEFNKKYDSKLFEPGLIEKEGTFSDNILREVILILYFGSNKNQERYLFDQIPGDLFGSIYEQYLGTIISETGKRIKLSGKTGKRKKMGIYYTPSYIVDYIVKNTVGEYIKDKTIDEILNVKILDPACGSGSFITRAFVEVCNVIEDKLNKGEEGSKILFKKTKEKIWKLSLGQKIEILRNCIYGVDLDEKAVELARLNLLLKLLDEESQETQKLLLPHLEGNIKCGNSLIDDLKVSDRAFNWNAQFPDVFRNGGFDVVVGNPPYVRQEEIKEFKEYLNKNYETYVGTADLFVYFFEKSIKNLKNGGKFGFIVSNKFARAGYGEKLRNFILCNTSIKQYIDKFDDKVFSEATVDPCIIILEKSKAKSNHELIYNYNSQVMQNSLSINGWAFHTGSLNSLKNKIEVAGRKIKDFDNVNILRGILTGLTEAFIIDSAEKTNLEKNNKNKDLIKPYIRGRDIKRYLMKSPKLFILLAKDGLNIEKDNVEIYHHLLKYKNKLEKRWDKGTKWYNLRSCVYYKEFEKPKIIYPDISGNGGFYYDEEGFFFNNTAYMIAGNIKKAWIGLLNSKLLSWYYKQIASNLGAKGTRYFTQFVENIPLIELSPSQEKKIIDLVNQMLELQKKYHDEKISGNEKERLKQQIDNIDYEINEEVYKLYELTPEEIKIVEESLK